MAIDPPHRPHSRHLFGKTMELYEPIQSGDGMIDRLFDFLAGRKAPTLERDDDELKLSVAALLIEAARMDKNFDSAQRAAIERLLAEKFDLAPEAVHPLVEAAERLVRNTAQYFPFTQQIC